MDATLQNSPVCYTHNQIIVPIFSRASSEQNNNLSQNVERFNNI